MSDEGKNGEIAQESQDSEPKKGRRGGARAGAGRKAKPRHLEDFDAIPPPPAKDPLKRAAWAQRIVAIDMYRIVKGRANRTDSQEIRASARTIAVLTPFERLAEAEDLIKGENKKRRSRAGGPKPQPVSDGTAPAVGSGDDLEAGDDAGEDDAGGAE